MCCAGDENCASVWSFSYDMVAKNDVDFNIDDPEILMQTDWMYFLTQVSDSLS